MVKTGEKGRNWPFSTKMRHISLSKYWSKSQQFYWFTLEFLLSQLNWIDHAAWGQVCQNQGVWRTIRPKLEKKLQKHFGFFLRNMSEFCTESLITLLLYWQKQHGFDWFWFFSIQINHKQMNGIFINSTNFERMTLFFVNFATDWIV